MTRHYHLQFIVVSSVAICERRSMVCETDLSFAFFPHPGTSGRSRQSAQAWNRCILIQSTVYGLQSAASIYPACRLRPSFSYNGRLSCFLLGIESTLSSEISKARISFLRVSPGIRTSSMYPLAAARYGWANWSL